MLKKPPRNEAYKKLISIVRGCCDALQAFYPITQLVADAPEGVTDNLVRARDECKVELKAFDDMVAAQEAEIKQDKSNGVAIALGAGASALLILSALAVVVAKRHRSSSPTTALAATEQRTPESML